MIHITERTKRAEGRGTGEKENYKPWIRCRECNSTGTCVEVSDWKHGRMMQFLSQGEYMQYLILRWNDNVIDIREQYPLDRRETIRIADDLGVQHPSTREGRVIMTTDLLVTFVDDFGKEKYKAYTVKANRSDVFGDISKKTVQRCVEKMQIEKHYWNSKGVEFHIVFKDSMNEVLASNIRLAVQKYVLPERFTERELFCHLVATKEILVDMEDEYLLDHFSDLICFYRKELNRYKSLIDDYDGRLLDLS